MSGHLYQDYYKRAKLRLLALKTLLDNGAYADTVRESQELVELVLKGVLRKSSIDPPHWHDVGKILRENESLLPEVVCNELDKICELSKRLRRERELSFYGDEDFIPSEEYDATQASQAFNDCVWLLDLLAKELA